MKESTRNEIIRLHYGGASQRRIAQLLGVARKSAWAACWRIESLYKLARERFRRHAEWFEAFAERGRVSEIPGAHHLFITHPREVLREIDDFVSSLP